MRARVLRIWIVGAALWSGAGCGPDDLLGPGAPQGILGTVLIGPQCPVQSLDDPCPDLPYEANLTVRNERGDVVTHVRSDADGIFRVGLRPGIYRIDPESEDPFPIAQDQVVEVASGVYSEVTVLYDTGIR